MWAVYTRQMIKRGFAAARRSRSIFADSQTRSVINTRLKEPTDAIEDIPRYRSVLTLGFPLKRRGVAAGRQTHDEQTSELANRSLRSISLARGVPVVDKMQCF